MSYPHNLRVFSVATALLALMSTGAYAQWVEQAAGFPDPGIYINALDAVDEHVAWAVAGRIPVAPETGFTKTTDGGATWVASRIVDDPNLVVVDISAMDRNNAWTALDSFAGSPRIYRTTDGGMTWTWQTTAYPSPASFANCVHFYDLNNGIALGDPRDGYFEIYTTTDGGTNWVRVPEANIPPPLTDEFGFVAAAAYWGDIVWFGTSQGRVYRSTNRGGDWTVSDAGIGRVEMYVTFRDASNGLITALYSGGRWMLRTTDGGDTWTPLDPPPVPGEILNPNPVPSGGPGDVDLTYIVTSYGTFGPGGPGSAFSIDDGDTWILIDMQPHGPADYVGQDVGWSGGVTFSPTQGGIWKWVGTTSTEPEPGAVPAAQPMLAQSRPNPVRTVTTIEFTTPRTENVLLEVFTVRGEKIATLVSGELPRGQHLARWDANPMPSGVYFYRLQVGGLTETKKLLHVE